MVSCPATTSLAAPGRATGAPGTEPRAPCSTALDVAPEYRAQRTCPRSREHPWFRPKADRIAGAGTETGTVTGGTGRVVSGTGAGIGAGAGVVTGVTVVVVEDRTSAAAAGRASRTTGSVARRARNQRPRTNRSIPRSRATRATSSSVVSRSWFFIGRLLRRCCSRRRTRCPR